MTDPVRLGDAIPATLAGAYPHRLINLRDAAALTGLSVDEIRAAYLSGHIAGRTQKTAGGRVYAYQVVLSSAVAYLEHLVTLDAQAKATSDVIRNLNTKKRAS